MYKQLNMNYTLMKQTQQTFMDKGHRRMLSELDPLTPFTGLSKKLKSSSSNRRGSHGHRCKCEARVMIKLSF
jgi:hypothetical protein